MNRIKCAWCGKVFKKHHNRQTYCSKKCRREGYNEKNRLRVQKYRKKYPDNKTLGTGMVSSTPNADTSVEQKIIRNERKRLKI